jgi:glycosyltransferase involved in cell wall biosynthesis
MLLLAFEFWQGRGLRFKSARAYYFFSIITSPRRFARRFFRYQVDFPGTKDGDNAQPHIAVVEAYEGFIEFLSDEPEERLYAQGLGLDLEEIARRLDCRITVLCWDDWYSYENGETWVNTPATRPDSLPGPDKQPARFESGEMSRIPVSARDPEYNFSIRQSGLSSKSHGLINDSGLLFFVSYCLNKELSSLHARNPLSLVIFPMWGGIGYVAQMSRATEAPSGIDVPFAVVVTDTSANRQEANQEGLWVRHSVIRRQMEDISLALADLVLVFGSRGEETAIRGRLPEASPPVCAPRFIDKTLLERIESASAPAADVRKPLQLFLYEPQQPASGVLTVLDSMALLERKGLKLDRPVISAGPSTAFAPMKPRHFEDYWSRRGFVRRLIHARQWKWEREYPQLDGCVAVRLYPSFFEHLPNIWAEMARGSYVLLSPAAAEGLAPGKTIPQEALIEGDPTPEKVADCIERILRRGIEEIDRTRQHLCRCVLEAHRGTARLNLLEGAARALQKMIESPPPPQDLSRVALLLLDRRYRLREIAEKARPPAAPEPRAGTKKGELSVVVTCYEMGDLIKEAVKSVWASRRRPDQILIVDDGSQDEATHQHLKELEIEAAGSRYPLEIIRLHNRGLAGARNAGLEAATGEFISFLDGDDLVEPLFYRTALALLDKYPSLGGVAAWAYCFGAGQGDGFWNAPQTEFPFLFIENSVIVPCLTRTELLRQIGGYDTRQRYNYEDWELSIRLLGSGRPIITIPMQLLKYRIRGDSLFRSMTDVQNQVMRELLFETHRELVSRFAVEIAMQLENQLWEMRFRTGAGDPDRYHAMKKLWKIAQQLLTRPPRS